MDEETRERRQKQYEEEIGYSEAPVEESCYKYKLVGINVHSGSANSGHYWSYINTTNRGGLDNSSYEQ